MPHTLRRYTRTCVKCFFFDSGQFEIPAAKLQQIRDFNVFIVMTYLKPWYSATDPLSAPRLDLEMLENLFQYPGDTGISNVALQAFRNHLWYLSGHCIGISFFDSKVDAVTKRKMVANLELSPVRGRRYRHTLPNAVNIDTLKGADLSQFVTAETKEFFKLLDIDCEFLKHDPTVWETIESYKVRYLVASTCSQM